MHNEEGQRSAKRNGEIVSRAAPYCSRAAAPYCSRAGRSAAVSSFYGPSSAQGDGYIQSLTRVPAVRAATVHVRHCPDLLPVSLGRFCVRAGKHSLGRSDLIGGSEGVTWEQCKSHHFANTADTARERSHRHKSMPHVSTIRISKPGGCRRSSRGVSLLCQSLWRWRRSCSASR